MGSLQKNHIMSSSDQDSAKQNASTSSNQNCNNNHEQPANNYSLEERKKWSDFAKSQVSTAFSTSTLQHRDELLTKTCCSSQIFSWHFNIFEFAQLTQGNPLITMTLTLLETHELLVSFTTTHPACTCQPASHQENIKYGLGTDNGCFTAQDGWKVNRKTVENFLRRVEGEYCPNAYHNNIHGADVTQTAAIILQSFAKQVNEVPQNEKFCIIMASAVHDLGHLGVNNDFLINSRHPRATTYNDKSVNENYHISRAFEIARTYPDCDIFELFTHDEQKKVS